MAATLLTTCCLLESPCPMSLTIMFWFLWECRTFMASSILVVKESSDYSIWSSSVLSISSSMPVIFPANSGYILCTSGYNRSPCICFCSAIGADARVEIVRGSRFPETSWLEPLFIDLLAGTFRFPAMVDCPVIWNFKTWNNHVSMETKEKRFISSMK